VVPNWSLSACGVLERNVRKENEGRTIEGVKDEKRRDERRMNAGRKEKM
jgi:hypothetical protein